MRAIVMGRNYTSLLGMIRAAGMTGCEVVAIRTVKGLNKASDKEKLTGGEPVEGASKYVKEHYFVDQDRDELVWFLLENCARKGERAILLPVDDFVASTVDMNQDKLRDAFVFPHINHTQGEVVRLMDKNLQKELARKAGLNVAEGWIVDIKEGKYVIPAGIKYPVFTKPEISFLGNKRCMKRCTNEAELVAVIKDVMKERECPILVEQFIQIEKEYAILGCAIEGNAYIPDLIHMIRDGSGAHKGVTMIGEISALNQDEDYVRNLKRFIKSTGFTGLFDIDLYESDGHMYFNELNLRFGASGYAVTASGINLPEILINSLLMSNKVEFDNKALSESVFVNEKVVNDDYYAGYISKKEKTRYINTADITFIDDKNDPSPGAVFKGKYDNASMQTRIRRSIRYILRRR